LLVIAGEADTVRTVVDAVGTPSVALPSLRARL